jgi:hypothetical protein
MVKLLQLVAVAAAAACCYMGSLNGEMVLDDNWAVTNNADVRPQTPVAKLLHNDFWGMNVHSETSHKSWRPLTVLTLRWNFEKHQLDTFGYHAVNVALHVAVSVLFCVLCGRLLAASGVRDGSFAAFAAGLLFATHPVHTDAVSSIVGRAEVLSALLFVLAMLFYVSCSRKSCPLPLSLLYLALALALSVLAMLSKEQGITVLPLCMCVDFLLHGCGGEPRNAPAGLASLLTLRLPGRLTFRLLLVGGFFAAASYARVAFTGMLVHDDQSANPASTAPALLTRVLTYHAYFAQVV